MNALFKYDFEPELQGLIAELPEIEIPKGAVIVKEGSYIKEIPLLLNGNIKVRKTDENGKELVLYHLGAGDSCILSITSCFNNKIFQAEAIAEEVTKIIVVPATKVKEWMDSFKSWRSFVMTLYYTRLESLLNLVDSISFKQTDSRLYDKLRELQVKFGNELQVTHQDLANEIGTAREVISRLLKQLEKDGFIVLERGSIKIIRTL